MKKTLHLFLITALLLAGLTACQSKPTKTERTPEELTALYSEAITAARTDEDNEYNPILTNTGENPDAELIFSVLGVTAEDMDAYAISVSLMNVRAYAVAAIKPTEGKEETVTTALQTYVDNTKASFEFYLPEPFEVASNARLETLEDGTVLLVMCEDQDTVFDSISSSILEG